MISLAAGSFIDIHGYLKSSNKNSLEASYLIICRADGISEHELRTLARQGSEISVWFKTSEHNILAKFSSSLE